MHRFRCLFYVGRIKFFSGRFYLMNNILGILVLAVSLSINFGCNAEEARAVKPIELTNSNDIKDAFTINNAIDALSNKVMECAKKSKKPEECHCLFPQDKTQLAEIYKTTISKHPHWQNEVIFWQRDDGYSYNLSLDGVKRSLALKCPTHPSSGTPSGAPYVKR